MFDGFTVGWRWWQSSSLHIDIECRPRMMAFFILIFPWRARNNIHKSVIFSRTIHLTFFLFLFFSFLFHPPAQRNFTFSFFLLVYINCVSNFVFSTSRNSLFRLWPQRWNDCVDLNSWWAYKKIQIKERKKETNVLKHFFFFFFLEID